MLQLRPYKLPALSSYSINHSREETPILFDDKVAEVLDEMDVDYGDVLEPRSVYSFSKLLAALARYDPSEEVTVVLDEHVKRGIALAFRSFAKPRGARVLKRVELGNESVISNWSGSAGLTAYGQSKREAFSHGVSVAKDILTGAKAPEPCLAFARTQKAGKTRLVWGYPLSMTLIEGIVGYPLIQEFKALDTPMAFAERKSVTGAKILSSTVQNAFWYGLDASSFDATIQRVFIDVAFSILRTWFDGADKYTQHVLSVVQNYFTFTPIVIPRPGHPGETSLVVGKRFGVPSGSYFTQLVDSIVNTIVLGALSSRFGFRLNFRDFMVLGDDSVFFTDTHLDLSVISEYVQTTFGIRINPEKSKHGRTGEDVPFLGVKWRKGIPYRDPREALAKMLYPERFRKYNNVQREAILVVASYALSAMSSRRLIPRLRGWNILLPASGVNEVADKLNGYLRYRMKYEGLGPKSQGGTLSALECML